jgi:ribosomal protein L7/L12
LLAVDAGLKLKVIKEIRTILNLGLKEVIIKIRLKSL